MGLVAPWVSGLLRSTPSPIEQLPALTGELCTISAWRCMNPRAAVQAPGRRRQHAQHGVQRGHPPLRAAVRRGPLQAARLRRQADARPGPQVRVDARGVPRVGAAARGGARLRRLLPRCRLRDGPRQVGGRLRPRELRCRARDAGAATFTLLWTEGTDGMGHAFGQHVTFRGTSSQASRRPGVGRVAVWACGRARRPSSFV